MTLSKAAKKIRAKRAARPIYMTCMRLMDPATGELHGCFVPTHPIDKRLAKERGYKTGQEYRAELKQSRVAWQHRLIHKIGQLVVDNVDGWEQMESHDAIKRLQRESGVCCEEVEIDIPGMGKLVAKQAESLAFDDMPQDRFQLLFDGITEYIGKYYSHVMLDDVRAEFWGMAGTNRRAA